MGPASARPMALIALLLASAPLVACTDVVPGEDSGLEAPDMQLAARYAVEVDVLDVGEGCVIGGLTPSGEPARASTTQSGAKVQWKQIGESGSGPEWILTGHVCPGDGGHGIRLYGGRISRTGDGDDSVCQVELALPTGHVGGRRAQNRCLDEPCSTLELVSDGCGGWVGEFEARLSYGADCIEQPECIMHMRWHAVPDGADEECTPQTDAAAAWMVECRTLP